MKKKDIDFNNLHLALAKSARNTVLRIAEDIGGIKYREKVKKDLSKLNFRVY